MAAQPHIFGLAEAARVEARRRQLGQLVVLHGEPGSGKSESAKLLLLHFAATAPSPVPEPPPPPAQAGSNFLLGGKAAVVDGSAVHQACVSAQAAAEDVLVAVGALAAFHTVSTKANALGSRCARKLAARAALLGGAQG